MKGKEAQKEKKREGEEILNWVLLTFTKEDYKVFLPVFLLLFF